MKMICRFRNMGSGMANNILKKIENKSDLYVYTGLRKNIKNG